MQSAGPGNDSMHGWGVQLDPATLGSELLTLQTVLSVLGSKPGDLPPLLSVSSEGPPVIAISPPPGAEVLLESNNGEVYLLTIPKVTTGQELVLPTSTQALAWNGQFYATTQIANPAIYNATIMSDPYWGDRGTGPNGTSPPPPRHALSSLCYAPTLRRDLVNESATSLLIDMVNTAGNGTCQGAEVGGRWVHAWAGTFSVRWNGNLELLLKQHVGAGWLLACAQLAYLNLFHWFLDLVGGRG